MSIKSSCDIYDYQSSEEEEDNQEVMHFGEESCDDDLCSIDSTSSYNPEEVEEEEFDEYDYSDDEDESSERNTSREEKEPIIIYLEPIPCVATVPVWPAQNWGGYYHNGSPHCWPPAMTFQWWPQQLPLISYKIAKVTKPNRVKNHFNNNRIQTTLAVGFNRNNSGHSSSCATLSNQ